MARARRRRRARAANQRAADALTKSGRPAKPSAEQGWTLRTDDEGVLLKAPGTCVMPSTPYIPFVGVTIRTYFRRRLLVEKT